MPGPSFRNRSSAVGRPNLAEKNLWTTSSAPGRSSDPREECKSCRLINRLLAVESSRCFDMPPQDCTQVSNVNQLVNSFVELGHGSRRGATANAGASGWPVRRPRHVLPVLGPFFLPPLEKAQCPLGRRWPITPGQPAARAPANPKSQVSAISPD